MYIETLDTVSIPNLLFELPILVYVDTLVHFWAPFKAGKNPTRFYDEFVLLSYYVIPCAGIIKEISPLYAYRRNKYCSAYTFTLKIP